MLSTTESLTNRVNDLQGFWSFTVNLPLIYRSSDPLVVKVLKQLKSRLVQVSDVDILRRLPFDLIHDLLLLLQVDGVEPGSLPKRQTTCLIPIISQIGLKTVC